MLGERIKQRRMALGYSQEYLAEKLGYKSKSSIQKIESGVNDIPQSKITQFARALDTTESFLIGIEEKPAVQEDDELTQKKKEFMEMLRQVDDETFDLVYDMLRPVIERQENKNS